MLSDQEKAYLRNELEAWQEVEKAINDADDPRNAWLKHRGWTHSYYGLAGNYMWQKALPDGKNAIVSIETAYRIETEIATESFREASLFSEPEPETP